MLNKFFLIFQSKYVLGAQKNRFNFVQVVMDVTMGSFFFKPEKNLEFFRLKNDPIDDYPGRLE